MIANEGLQKWKREEKKSEMCLWKDELKPGMLKIASVSTDLTPLPHDLYD